MVPSRPKRLAVVVLLALAAACSEPSGSAREGAGRDETGYLAPPQLLAGNATASGVRITGKAAPAARLRLATPAGEIIDAAADQNGDFAFDAPVGADARIFGLSVLDGDRRVQAEGYVLVTPKRQVALLRAGSAARRLDMGRRHGVGAFDFDASGAATVAGRAPAGEGLSIRLNGRQALEASSGADERYAAALPSLPPGRHSVEVMGDGFTQAIVVDMTPAAPLTGAPMRAVATQSGLRVDWITPGGGVQSTLIVD